jgi:hypothetical protein
MRWLCRFLWFFIPASLALAVEEPQYTVLVQQDGFELRQYAPMIVAETWVNGDMDTASNKGFRIIADYIFGNNKAPQSTQSNKIAMTAPVTVVPDLLPLKLDTSASISLQPDSGTSAWADHQRWLVQFVMPREYTLGTLPTPNNDAVKLREVTGQTVAVKKYSGFNTDSRIQTETQALKDWAQSRQLLTAGPAQLARYDPPWTLPMFRRNEIHLVIKDPSPSK